MIKFNYLIISTFVLSIISLYSCSSIPSSYKLKPDESSIGVNIRIITIQDKPMFNFDVDIRKSLNENFDIGLTLIPGVILNIFTPYVVAKYSMSDQTNIIGDVQIPVYIYLLDIEPGVGISSSLAVGGGVQQSINEQNIVSVGGIYDLSRDLTMRFVNYDGLDKPISKYSNFVFRLGHSFSADNFVFCNNFLIDLELNPMYTLSGIVKKITW